MAQHNLARHRLLAIAGLSVVIYGAAAHFATYAYVIPVDRGPAIYSLVYWLRDTLTAAGVYFAFRLVPRDIRPDVQWRPANGLWYLASAVLGALFYFISEFIITTYGKFGIHGTSALTEFRHLSIPFACLVLLSVGIVSPILQELVFRGWLLSGLRRIVPATSAIVISAALFSLMHIQSGIPALTHSFLFGLVAGILFLRSRSIIPSTILHIVVNSISTIVWLTDFVNR